MSQEIKRLIDSINTGFESFKEINDERLAALEKGDKSLAQELDVKLDTINAEISTAQTEAKKVEAKNNALKERIEILESLQNRPGITVEEKANNSYSEAFINWMRSGGTSRDAESEMRAAGRKLAEVRGLQQKDIVIGTAASGGYAVPEIIGSELDALMLKMSDILNEVRRVTVGSSDYKELLSIHGGTSGWVGETDTRSATGTPNLREVAPTWGELYAYPQVSEWALQDIFFDVQNWLVDDIGEGMSKAVDASIYSGDGSNKPTGMTNTAPVTTADHASPLRAKAAYQYVPTNATSPQAVNLDDIIDLVYTLNRAYRPNAKFAANTLTQGAMRKLKNSNGDYLWEPSQQVGQPARLLGYPIVTWEDLSDPTTADGFPVAFGDFRRAYLLVNRRELAITVENVTTPGYVKFYIRRRWGGIPRNNDALKFLKLADT